MSILDEIPSLTTEHDKKIVRGVFRESLFHLCKYGLGMSDITWATHGDMINALEELEFRRNGTKRALIIMPRGSLKSSVSSIGFPIWRLIRDFNKRILIDSATYDLSTLLVSAIAQHLESDTLTNLFGTFKTREDWSSKSITIAQRTRILKEPSVGASGVGSPKTGSHYDCLICDDLNNEKNSNTNEGMEKVAKHYQMNFAILDPDGDACVVATRYAALDVPGHILTNEIGLDMLPDYLKSSVS